MQKIELRNNINAVVQGLKSNEVIAFLDQGNIDKNALLSLLIESKSGYDQAATDEQKKKVFEQFETQKIYSTPNFTALFSFVTQAPNNNRSTFLSNNTVNNLYAFHKTLVSTYRILNNLLFESDDIFVDNEFDIQKNQNRGNLILQIIEDEKVDLKKFNEIIESLENLIETVYMLFEKIEGETLDKHPKVQMIDSGSDINFVLKLPEKAANLIAQVFKQFWDLIANNRSYRYQQRLKDVEKSITVLEKINEAKNNQVIDPETAEVLKKGIISNTERIIFRNTLTKQIVMESVEYSNRQVLIEKSKTFLLGEGEKEESENKEDGE